MVASRHAILLVLMVAFAAGCQSSPWSAQRTPVDQARANPGSSAPAAPPASATQGQPSQQPTPPLAGPDPKAMQEVIAQVQQLDDVDPATRQQLLEDLKQTDPRLWQDVIRQFRATLAYRQQLHERPLQPPDSSAAQQGVPGGVSSPSHEQVTMSLGPAPPSTPSKPEPPATAKRPLGLAQDRRAVGSAPVSAAVADVAVPGRDAPPSQAAPAKPSQGPASTEAATAKEDRKVVQAAYETAAPDDSSRELAQAIRTMEASVAASPQSADEVTEHARLRMLYVLAGRRDDAFRPIPSATPSLQDFWSKELYGLATLLDTRQTDNPQRRAAETCQHLGQALDSLSRSSALVIRNLALVTQIQSYGNYRPFAEYKFTPGQEVLVYAEVENFVSEATPAGYVTSLSFGCQIFDSRGQRVAQHEFKSEEVCRNQRHDFFIGCDLRLPQRIYDGRHTLQLTVEDLKSQKIGQQSIEFTIVNAEK